MLGAIHNDLNDYHIFLKKPKTKKAAAAAAAKGGVPFLNVPITFHDERSLRDLLSPAAAAAAAAGTILLVLQCIMLSWLWFSVILV